MKSTTLQEINEEHDIKTINFRVMRVCGWETRISSYEGEVTSHHVTIWITKRSLLWFMYLPLPHQTQVFKHTVYIYEMEYL